MVTTGRIPASVRTHARNLTESTGYQAVLVDSKVLHEYRKQGATVLLKFFRHNAATTIQVKRDQVDVEEEAEV